MNIETLIKKFYRGRLSSHEQQKLYYAFLNRAEVRAQWPRDSRVILPLAIAWWSRQQAQPAPKSVVPSPRRHTFRIVAAASVTVAVAGAAWLSMEVSGRKVLSNRQPVSMAEFVQQCYDVTATSV